ncbi:hypothetical protein L1987_03581 [Smallanthus sonchifolius]|uniref:Uncharacterized protein n=1 Tax=Smallanthus sonchifolius TaxID=185202 RepID=A0ACB9KAX2_9ASTR|nr:hypothetical protein L1987_03581 [Smallanthus sonchifolius]
MKAGDSRFRLGEKQQRMSMVPLICVEATLDKQQFREKQLGSLLAYGYGCGSDSRNEGKFGNVNLNANTPRSCRTVWRAVSSGYCFVLAYGSLIFSEIELE